MNFILFALAIVFGGMTFVSCSSDNNEIVDDEVKVLTSFEVSSNRNTRAYWSSNAVYWNHDDLTKVFVTGHTTGDVFEIASYNENQDYLTFKGYTYPQSDNHDYYVVYPAGQANFLNGDKVNITIPDVQDAKPGSFDPKACIQIGGATVLGQTVQLEHVCAFFKIEVTAACDYVKISPNQEGYGIVGTVEANLEGAIDPNNGWKDRKHTVTLKDLPSDGIYLIGVGPSDGYTGGITVEVKYPGTDPITKSTTQTLQLKKGYVYNLGKCNKPQVNP